MNISPKNKEQETAVQIGVDFLDTGNPSEWLIIGGKAGTGKTTIAQMIIKDHVDKSTILVCALSHKAKLVISEKLKEAFGDQSIISKSVAGALGMNMDQETGLFTIDRGQQIEPAIKRAKIILIDEASMINEQSHELIMKEKQRDAKVIYLGDIRQLPPIRERDSEFTDKPSPIFYGKNYSILTERIRQGEESPILPFADFFGDNSRKIYPSLNPVPESLRINIVNEKGALVFADNIYEVINDVLPLYKYAIEKKNMNVIKIVTYRNEPRRQINNFIREALFGKEAFDSEFLAGELLIFHDNYSIPDMVEPISNSFEIQVTKAIRLTDIYKLWEIEFVYDGAPCKVLVLDKSDVKRHASDVSKKFDYAKRLPFGLERTEALSKAWELKKRYASLEYAYAITSHKSQGSTYNTVIVDERDIMGVSMTTNKSKSQSMYVGITRASVTCIVIDAHKSDESLKKAIELSTKSLEILTLAK